MCKQSRIINCLLYVVVMYSMSCVYKSITITVRNTNRLGVDATGTMIDPEVNTSSKMMEPTINSAIKKGYFYQVGVSFVYLPTLET